MPDDAPTVTTDRPYRFYITFLCEQPISPSDRVNIQLGLYVSNGRADPGGGMVAREVQMSSSELGFGGARPPAPAASVSRPNMPPDPARPVLGFRVSVVPDGAYIREVIPGSAAEKAGLLPGMVISELNGVSLKGKDAAALDQILSTAPNDVVIQVIGKGTVKLRKAAVVY